MSFYLFIKSTMIWFIIAFFAVLNGILRENILTPYLGKLIALPVSGITISLLIFTITYLFFDLFAKHRKPTYISIGFLWVSMTLIFEFIFGHYVIGKSWIELFQVFNLFEGNLFILALFTSFISPLLVSQIKK